MKQEHEHGPLTAMYNGRTLEYMTDGHTDFVTDKHFYEYMLDRPTPPEKVVLFDTKQEMLQTLGIQL